ncbi:MAG TPA: DHHA1 domain-containing protein [Leptospiraceae bacterium]|nr:DHHA1 domain-containing protein [Leptospiraceae bacterium]
MGILKTLAPLLGHPDYSGARDPFYFSRAIRSLRSPLDLPDMEKGIAMLRSVIEAQGHVLVVGDRDVDGVSSAALLANFLRDQHAKRGGGLEIRVSDLGDDYGLSGELFENVRDGKADLVILLDMGSSHGPEIHELIAAGKKVIVLDHHQVSDRRPSHDLCAFINPQLNAEVHENEGKIPTVGLAFKFLFGYALSHIAEWNNHSLVDLSFLFSENANAGARFAVYRCGCLVESGENISGAHLRPLDADGMAFLKHERERILQSEKPVVTIGSLLLSRIVETRPRLLDFLMSLSDLVSVGMITDMVPLAGENRSLVRIGLGMAGKRVRRGVPGYRALIGALDLPEFDLTGRDLAWSIGPAINAAGRMGNTALALDLLTSDSPVEAERLARELKALNKKRQERTRSNERIVTEHFEAYPEKTDRPIIFCYHESLEPGVSGIMATRLLEKYGKPVVYINPDGKWAKGSARGEGHNVLQMLDCAAHLFIQFGGHPEAAGFSLPYERIEELERVLLENAPFMDLEPVSLEIRPHLDLLPEQINRRLYDELRQMEPFGPGNPEPLIRITGAQVTDVTYMKDKLHARFRIRGSRDIEFVAWRRGTEFGKDMERVDLIGSLERSIFAGRTRIQFRVEHVKAAAVLVA